MIKVRRLKATRVAQVASAAALCFAAEAHAAPCSDLPNAVLTDGSSAMKPFVKQIGIAFAKLSGDDKLTILYKSEGSCLGVGYFTDGAVTSTTGTALYWDTAGTELTCDLEVTPGTDVDVGLSDVYPTTCGKTLANDAREYHGPVQSMTFIKPVAATTQPDAISYAAAYLAFNFGTAGQVSPWSDEAFFHVRNNSSGTQLMIGSAIHIPAGVFKGFNEGGSDNVWKNTYATPTTSDNRANDIEKSIGIVASDAADLHRDVVKVLAYKHKGQDKAYWPDSAPNKFDKQNVRDGHYFIWGPAHVMARIDSSTGEFSNANAGKFVQTLSGAIDPPGDLDLIKVEAAGSVVPDCAMQVSRDTEGGELSCYLPERVCTCKFLASTPDGAPNSCKSCQNDSQCSGSTPKCSFGYCEVR